MDTNTGHIEACPINKLTLGVASSDDQLDA